MHLIVRFRLHSGSYAGQTSSGVEWPPSPCRALGALVSASLICPRISDDVKKGALLWLERLGAPLIIAPGAVRGPPHRTSVPNNDMDILERRKDPPSRSELYSLKESQEMYPEGGEISYVWTFSKGAEHVPVLAEEAKYVDCLGRGETHATCRVETAETLGLEPGIHWQPGSGDRNPLRVPREGTYEAMRANYAARLTQVRRNLVENALPREVYDTVSYGNEHERRVIRLTLEKPDGSFCPVNPIRAATVAALLRHECLRLAEEEGFPAEALQSFVRGVGLRKPNEQGSNQRLSYVPLASIGHHHADGWFRRALVCEPAGVSHEIFTRLAARLGRSRRELTSGDGKVSFVLGRPEWTRADHRMYTRYLRRAQEWVSVTPVVSPQTLNKPGRVRRALQRMLQHAGYGGMEVDARMSPTPLLRQAEPPLSYQCPHHLHEGYPHPMVHMSVRFKQPVAGPLLLGNGRHGGLGVFARDEEEGTRDRR